MLVSAVQWSESAIRIHLFPASWASLPPSSPPSHPPTSSQNIKWSSLCYTAASHYLSISHMVVHNGTPLQYSCLGNPMDGGAWWAVVCGVAESQTWLSRHTHCYTTQQATTTALLTSQSPSLVILKGQHSSYILLLLDYHTFKNPRLGQIVNFGII